MKAHNLPNGVQMHVYDSPKEQTSIKTFCETCGITMRTRDWRGHETGKRHKAAVEKIRQAERGALNAERLATSWGDEANEAAANDSAAINGDFKQSNSRACRNCGQEGHFAKECPKPRSGGGGRACHNCGSTDHLARECPEPRSGGGRGGRACHNCGSTDHLARECPEPRSGGPGGGGRACHNCGSTDHLARECPERTGPRCYKCGQPGHISRDCTYIKCDNCDAEGHLWQECELPRDQKKIDSERKCHNCHQKGHKKSDCPQAASGGSRYGVNSGVGGFDNFAASFNDASGFDNAAVDGSGAAPGDWNSGFAGTEDAAAASSGGWNNAPVADDDAGMW